ncbi:MAG: hypothetical protein ABSB33_09915 [Tepidisphaeraceae bacterium]
MNDFDATMRRGGDSALQEAAKFFMGTDPVHHALRAIAARLEELAIPYAVAGGMALVAHGYNRTTVDVDLLVTPEGHAKARSQLDGLRYVPVFTSSKNLRDTQTGVRIEFLLTGQFPGDGKPKPVAFPDPDSAGVVIDGVRYLKLENLIELKLASGMTNPGRLKDLADVQELIRILKLGHGFEGKLDPYVRAKFADLRQAVEMNPAD